MPNWLGDMIMATAFVNAIKAEYPTAAIDLIVKKELVEVANYIPGIATIHSFDKKAISSRKFGKQLSEQKKFDLFFCLPNSFSSAQMAFASKAEQRIGYKKELRSVFLTNSFKKPTGVHRVEEYLQLLSLYTKKEISVPTVAIQTEPQSKRNAVIVNINSEAQSRRLPMEKAIDLLNQLRNEISEDIILVGSHKEKEHVAQVYNHLADTNHIINLAGSTTLPETINLFASVKAVLTTDSGPAHIANAIGVPTIVLFGAGDENSTSPYNKANREIIRLGKLDCEKCVSNTCKKFDTPRCLLDLENETIIQGLKKYL